MRNQLAIMINSIRCSSDVVATENFSSNSIAHRVIRNRKNGVDRSLETTQRRIRSTLGCGKLVSFMWKNCRKDVALTFDFYTNSRSGCCSFEEIGLFGYSIRREHDTKSPNKLFRQRVFKYRLLDIDRSSTASDVRSVRQLISLFGGCIRGQEKSWGNEEEGS